MMIFAPSESYRSPPLFGPVIEAKYEFYFNRLRALEIYKTALTGNLQMKSRGGSSSSRYSPSLFLFLFYFILFVSRRRTVIIVVLIVRVRVRVGEFNSDSNGLLFIFCI